jgi:hypothetical protein
MTERGLPIVDGAPACPFVAFEDDRDERAASPDHRHRCYAEAQPAPRALAHQEAYCLASAFPVCPTFQDWARREAARSRTDAPRPSDSSSLAAAAAAQQPQRNPPRNWAAPPPWSGGRGGASQPPDGDWADEPDDGPADDVPDVPRRGRGLSGSFADRVVSEPGVPGMGREPDYEQDAEPDEDEDEAPIGEAPPYVPAYEPPRAEPPRAEPPRAGPRHQEPVSQGAWDQDDDQDEPEPQVRRRRERDLDRVAPVGAAAQGPARSAGGGGAGGGPARHERRRDSNAPEWERARPMEAYPTLRSRRLSELSIPPILVAVVALALAAAVLFALPGLLGFGNPSADESTAPTTPVKTPIVTAAPTPVPAPTDQIYVVKAGDTLSRIAGRFNISLEELIAANAETLPDPDKLQIGDQLIIPAIDPNELPAASEIPAAQ